MKKALIIFSLLFIFLVLLFTEVIVLKDDRTINGKIIKMDEDTITIITKTEEIVIEKEDVAEIYYSEKDYEESILLLEKTELINKINKKITIGFAQVGIKSNSDMVHNWFLAMSQSVQQSARDAGYEIIFNDAKWNQANQMKAVKNFIKKKVDVIFIVPAGHTGWGKLLREAKKAKIPIILINSKGLQENDNTLWASTMNNDYITEGEKAAEWLGGYLKKKGIDDGKKTVNIVQLEGNTGLFQATGRIKGFTDIMNTEHPNWKIPQTKTANFNRKDGKSVMIEFLKSDKTIQVVYAHNDEMAFGAIAAIEEAGLKPGKDIVIVSIDGTREALRAIIGGKMNCTVECNPLIGPKIVQVVRDIIDKKTLPREIIFSEDAIFDQENAEKELKNRQY